MNSWRSCVEFTSRRNREPSRFRLKILINLKPSRVSKIFWNTQVACLLEIEIGEVESSMILKPWLYPYLNFRNIQKPRSRRLFQISQSPYHHQSAQGQSKSFVPSKGKAHKTFLAVMCQTRVKIIQLRTAMLMRCLIHQ